MKTLNKCEIENVFGGVDAPKYDCKIISIGIVDGGRIIYDFKLAPTKYINTNKTEEIKIGADLIEGLSDKFTAKNYIFVCENKTPQPKIDKQEAVKN